MWQVRIRKKNLQVYEKFYTQEEAENYYIRLHNCLLPSQMRSIDKAISVIHEMSQLISSGKHLTINTKPNYIKFTYTTLNDRFQNTLEDIEEETTNYRGDNNGKRNISLIVTGDGNVLNLKISAVGLESISELTGKEENNEFIVMNKSLYALITERSTLDCITYKVLSIMLSNTQQHNKCMLEEERKSKSNYYKGKLRTVFSNSRDLIYSNRNNNTIINCFKDIEADKTAEIVELLVKEFDLKENIPAKTTTAIICAGMEDKEVKEILKGFASKQHAEMIKMIKFVRRLEIQKADSILNFIYRKVSYRC